jgi:hypothetical protein
LRGVDPGEFVAKVEPMWRLRGHSLELVSAVHHPDAYTAGIDQVDRHAAE